MVGDELVQQVVLAAEVVVIGSVRIDILPTEVVQYIFHGNGCSLLAYLSLPEVIGLGKEGVTVVAVFGHGAIGIADT